jgi:hypothetical protein
VEFLTQAIYNINLLDFGMPVRVEFAILPDLYTVGSVAAKRALVKRLLHGMSLEYAEVFKECIAVPCAFHRSFTRGRLVLFYAKPI